MSDDPFLSWLARQPVGRPLSSLERHRIREAEALIARGGRGVSTADLLAHARAHFADLARWEDDGGPCDARGPA